MRKWPHESFSQKQRLVLAAINFKLGAAYMNAPPAKQLGGQPTNQNNCFGWAYISVGLWLIIKANILPTRTFDVGLNQGQSQFL